MKRTRVFSMILAVALLAALAAPAAADPPERFEDPFPVIFPDLEQELVVFVNTTRGDQCTPAVIQWEKDILAWLEDGADPAEEPVPPMFTSGEQGIAVQMKETGQGAIVAHAKAKGLTIELWHMDAPANRPLIGPCTDTDDEGSVFAWGTTSFHGNDNDFFGSGTRGNAFGDRGHAHVTDGTDDYRYSWVFHLNDRCYVPDDGPPACLIERSSLR